MQEFFLWFTDLGNSKTVAAVLFFSLFISIVIYVFTGKSRKEKYDSYRFIPLQDDEDDVFMNQKDNKTEIDTKREDVNQPSAKNDE